MSGDIQTLPGPDASTFTTDYVPWNGVDDTAALTAAVAAAAYPKNLIVYLLPGVVYKLFSTLIVGQQFKMVGNMGSDQGAEIWYYGPDATNCIQSASSGATQQSQFRMEGVRIVDKRTSPTSGNGINLNNVVNGTFMRDVFVKDFPTAQIYIGADVGHAGDCVDLQDIWVGGTVANNIGISIERQANNVRLAWISGAISGGGAMIQLDNITNDACVSDFSEIKHEPSDATVTIYCPTANFGNLNVNGVVQRPSAGTGATIVKFGTSPTRRFTGSNITGSLHVTWASGACALEDTSNSKKVWGPVQYVIGGASGGFFRHVSGTGTPNSAIFGNVGDLYTDVVSSSQAATQYVKASGNATNTGWVVGLHVPFTQSLAYAASRSVNLGSGQWVTITAMSAAMTIQTPTNIPVAGRPVIFTIQRDATVGSFAVTWPTECKGTWTTAAGTANQTLVSWGMSDGTNIIFQGTSGWY